MGRHLPNAEIYLMVSTPVPALKQDLVQILQDPNLETYQLQMKYGHISDHICILIL